MHKPRVQHPWLPRIPASSGRFRSKYAVALLVPQLLRLDGLREELSAKEPIPKAACHAKTRVVVEEVMLEMILLQPPTPPWDVPVMEKVMRKVVTDVPKDAAAVDSGGNVPVRVQNEMCKFPEGKRNRQKQSWGHNEAVLVHGQVVVDAVKEEV